MQPMWRAFAGIVAIGWVVVAPGTVSSWRTSDWVASHARRSQRQGSIDLINAIPLLGPLLGGNAP